jgi:hypothetical protein
MCTEKTKLNPRKVFWQCGACSHAMFHLLNHEFDNTKPREENASDLLAGGIAQKGHQCGMLWGGSLAIGTEAYKKFSNKNIAMATSIHASKVLADSFQRRTNTVNCRDIARVDRENKFDFIIYMLKTMGRGFIYSPCFNLIVKWTPEAIQAATAGLSESKEPNPPCLSCSSEVVKKMGATEEESVMVAGFAGGLGLSGYACGALAAAIWYKMLDWGKNNPGKSPSYFNNQETRKILRIFYMQTDSEMICESICHRKFLSADEHSGYIKSGGCKNIIEALAKA